MPISNYAKEVALALFEQALKEGKPIAWLNELRLASDLLKDKALYDQILDKKIKTQDRAKILADRGSNLNTELSRLLGILLDNDRIDQIDYVVIEYQRLLDEYHGIEGAQIANVTTAVKLDDNLKLEMGKKLTRIAGKPVIINSAVDPDILGGMIIRMGDKLIDGSVRSKLQSISKELV
jgi:F-type H+-transporting ATPase subunit delta